MIRAPMISMPRLTMPSEEAAKRMEELFAVRLQKEVDAAYARGKGEAECRAGIAPVPPKAPVEATPVAMNMTITTAASRASVALSQRLLHHALKSSSLALL